MKGRNVLNPPLEISDARWSELPVAVIRLLTVPLVAANAYLVPPRIDSGFLPVLVLFAAYSVWCAVRARSGTRPPLPWWILLVDVALLTTLCALSGGLHSEVRRTLYLPITGALFFPPRITTAVGVAAVAGYLASAVGGGGEVGSTTAFTVSLAWFAGVMAGVSVFRAHRTRQLREATAQSQQLVAQALNAAEQERERISESLHADAVQDIVLALQDLDEPDRGAAERLLVSRNALRHALEKLRAAIAELHPAVLEHGGLEAALRSVAARVAERGGYRCSVEVAPQATRRHDRLLLSLGTELLYNAAKHAKAENVWVTVSRDAGDVVLEVCDDGVGISEERVSRAVSEGHIGLASSIQRVEALGGSIRISARTPAGTRVSVRLPYDQPEHTAAA